MKSKRSRGIFITMLHTRSQVIDTTATSTVKDDATALELCAALRPN